MNAQRTSRRGSPLHFVTGPATVALLLSVTPAGAGWKPPVSGSTAAAGAATASVGYSLRKNLSELIEQFGEVIGAGIEEDDEAVARLAAETDRFSGKLVGDSYPVLKGVSYSIDVSRTAVAGFKEKLRSAQRKIGRLAGKAGETVIDMRAALAIDENERRWYESESGILDIKPLPAARVPVPPSMPVSAPVQDDDVLPWRERGSNPVGEYALRCGGEYGVSRYTVFYSHWKRLMEEHSGECPTDRSYDNEWNAVLYEGGKPDPWAPEQEEQLEEEILPVYLKAGSYNQEDDIRYEEAVPEYRTELAALERQRQADEERQRLERVQAAEEERLREREQEKARAEAERERLEYQRKAAERERRELEKELAAARSSQLLRDSINQGVQRLNQHVEILKTIRAGQRGGVGSVGKRCPSGYRECNGKCYRYTGGSPGGCE